MIIRENFDNLINELSDELGVEKKAEDYKDFWDDVYEDYSDLPLEALEEANKRRPRESKGVWGTIFKLEANYRV